MRNGKWQISNNYFPKRNDSSIIGSSPLTPTSLTLFTSGASDVVSISNVTPSFPPLTGGRNITRPQILISPLAVLRDALSNRNSYPSYGPTLAGPSDTLRYTAKFFAN